MKNVVAVSDCRLYAFGQWHCDCVTRRDNLGRYVVRQTNGKVLSSQMPSSVEIRRQLRDLVVANRTALPPFMVIPHRPGAKLRTTSSSPISSYNLPKPWYTQKN